ncbi:MAG: G3E family GTPase [Maribacter sp.]|jgi:G3E family GTPase
MRSLKSISFLLLITIILASCSTGQQQAEVQDPLLIEAFKYHNEAIEVEKSLQSIIEELNAKKSTIQSAGKELGEEDMKFIDLANRIEKSYKRWEENRIEVPGFEHEHDHSQEGHQHHNHGNDIQLTPQQMMEVQKESMKDLGDMLRKAEGMLQK